MNKVLPIIVNEFVDKYDDEWRQLCAAVVYRHGLELWEGTGTMLGLGRMGGHVHVERPAELSEEDAAQLSETLSSEMSLAIRKARRVRALTTLEAVEQLDQQLTAAVAVTRQAVDAMKTAAESAKSAAEYGELIATWMPRVVAAWAWIKHFS